MLPGKEDDQNEDTEETLGKTDAGGLLDNGTNVNVDIENGSDVINDIDPDPSKLSTKDEVANVNENGDGNVPHTDQFVFQRRELGPALGNNDRR